MTISTSRQLWTFCLLPIRPYSLGLKRQSNGAREANEAASWRWLANKPPLPSILLANVKSLENKLDELRSRLLSTGPEDLKHFLFIRVVAEHG
jgi:hypothetical protein